MASEQTCKMFQNYIYIFPGHCTLHTSVSVSLCIYVYTYVLIYHSCCGIEGIGVVVPSWYFCGLLHFPSKCSVRKGRGKPHARTHTNTNTQTHTQTQTQTHTHTHTKVMSARYFHLGYHETISTKSGIGKSTVKDAG
jgi:hypothetical protein